MTPIGIKLTLDGQREVSQGLKQVGNDVNALGTSGGKLGTLSQGMDKAAMSAGQLRMATQQLPLQFQDIVVSLQAGQQPLTVFLQQGSQIAGSFGGAAAAAKAMASYVAGLISPITALGAGVATLGVAYYQGSKEQDAWVKGIVTTGNASGVTTGQLREYARQIDNVVGTQREAAAALNDFVSAGVRGGDELRRYTEAAVLWERATGQAVSTTAKQFADLQNAPLQGVIKLNEGTNFLTASVYEQIKVLEEQGNNADAARIAMDALDEAMRDRAKEIDESLGYIERGWKGITGAASEAWDAMLGVGRKQTNRDLLSEAQAQLDTRVGRSDVLGNDDAMERGNAKLRARIQALQDLVAQEDLNAAAQAESARVTRARIEFDNKYSKALESEVSLQQKLQRARSEAEFAGKSEADIKRVLAYVTEEHNKSLDKGGSAAKQAKTSYETLLSTINQKIVAMQSEVVAGEKLTETERLRARMQEELTTRGRQYNAQQRADLEMRLQLLDRVEQQAIAARELAKAHESDAKALERLTTQRERSLETVNRAVQAAQDEERAAAIAAASNISNAEAVALVAQARAEDAYQQAVANGEAPQTLYFLEQEMAARRKLAEVMGQRTVREANEKAAKDMAREWEKMSQTIGDTLADYIMGGGRDAAQYLKRLFSTLVLQPVVQAGVGAILGTGVAGASGVAAGAASSAGGLGGLINLGQSLYGALSSPLLTNFGGAMAGNIQQLGGTLFSKGFETLGSSVVDFGNTVARFSEAINIAGDVFGYGSALYSLSKGNYGTAIGTAVGTYFGGPIGAFIGSQLGGLVDGLFGRKLKDTGIQGTFGGDVGFQGVSYAHYSGGLFKKSKTTYSALDEGTRSALADQFLGIRSAVVEMGEVLGLMTDQVYGATYSINMSLQGLSESQVNERMKAQFESMADSMSAMVLATDKYSLAEERRFNTLQRLATHLSSFNTALEALGLSVYKASVDAANGAYKIIAALGGMDSYGASIDSYYKNYYSEAEKVALATQSLTKAFAAYGAELPDTAEQYRAMVEQQIRAAESGDSAAAAFAATLLGLNEVFKQVSDAWKAELSAMSAEIPKFFSQLTNSVGSVLSEVSADRANIVRGNKVSSYEEIKAAIDEAQILAPSRTDLDNAQDRVNALTVVKNTTENIANSANSDLAAKQGNLSSLLNARHAAEASVARSQSSLDATWTEFNRIWNGRIGSYHWRLSLWDEWAAHAQRHADLVQRVQGDLAKLNPLIAMAQADVVAAIETANAAAQELANVQGQLSDAQSIELQERIAYAANVAQFLEDAEESVNKLSTLRGEVVKFYEAQAQAVQTMVASAGNLRTTVDQLRLQQLNTAQSASELGGRYARDYAMALSTTGSVRAGYVDAMAGNLAELTQALRAEASTSEDWRIQTAKLFAQANTAADLLQEDADNSDYEDVALELLDSIDAALGVLGANAKSAEQVIADAINAGTQAQLAGLRAIVAALRGEAIPAFATGGFHMGGLRIVGEHGPELEATGPSRIWNAQQLNQALGGGGSELVSEVRALREENQRLRQESQAHALAMLDQQERIERVLNRWDLQGTPEQRPAVGVAA